MAYTPTKWKTGDIVSSEGLNKLENGVAGSATTEELNDLKSQITQNSPNLFNFNTDWSYSGDPGVAFSASKNQNYVEMIGTATAGFGRTITFPGIVDSLGLAVGDEVTFTILVDGSISGTIYFSLHNETGTSIKITSATDKAHVTFNYTTAMSNLNIWVNNATVVNAKIWVQIEKGNKSTLIVPKNEPLAVDKIARAYKQDIIPSVVRKNICPSYPFEFGQYDSSTWYENYNRLTSDYFVISPNVKYTISCTDNAEVDVALINYNYFDEDKTWLGNRVTNGDSSFNGQRTHTLEITNTSVKYLRVTLRRYSSSDARILGQTPTTCKLQVERGESATTYEQYIAPVAYAITDDGNVLESVSKQEINKIIPLSSADYVIGSDLLKKNISVTFAGLLWYGQSFCIYDGKYYSTDGSHIAVQDENFTKLSTADLALGHGNSFQRGESNLAYVSGWDDDKLYIVDLDDLVISDTVTLPVSGYTTCAVNEENSIAYIFHRTSVPSTVDKYNFVVYDFANDEVLSTRVLDVEFGAMQACMYYEGRIIVLSGSPGSNIPNAYRIYDTQGNILANYVISSVTIEPEGVAMDAENNLYFSYSDSKVYKIS